MILIRGGKSALWWEQKRQMSGGKSDKGKWTTAPEYDGTWIFTGTGTYFQYQIFPVLIFVPVLF